jgi:Uma2 family endonuclease
MPVVATTIDSSIDEVLLRKKWTRVELELVEGVFPDADFELVEGELIDRRMGKNPPHSFALRCVLVALEKIFDPFRLQHEIVIDVAPQDYPTSRPEPDIVALNKPISAIRNRRANAADIELVVEIADTTLGFDLRTKRDLYARAGIPEYWVLDIQGRRLYVHRNIENGRYALTLEYSESERVEPLAAPGREFIIGSAFPSGE